ELVELGLELLVAFLRHGDSVGGHADLLPRSDLEPPSSEYRRMPIPDAVLRRRRPILGVIRPRCLAGSPATPRRRGPGGCHAGSGPLAIAAGGRSREISLPGRCTTTMVAARSGSFRLKKNRGLGLPVAAVIRLFRVNQPSFPDPGTQGQVQWSVVSGQCSVSGCKRSGLQDFGCNQPSWLRPRLVSASSRPISLVGTRESSPDSDH